MQMNDRDLEMMKTLNKYPEIKDGVYRICDMAEASKNKPKKADDAEEVLIEDLKGLGRNVFGRWAECRVAEESQAIEQSQVVHKHGKKK